MNFFGIDPEEKATTDSADRLQRPWAVFVFSIVFSIGVVVAIYAYAIGEWNDKAIRGLCIFAVAAIVLSGLYTWIGARYGKSVAHRIVGFIGLGVVLIGLSCLGYLFLAIPRMH
jgi:putative Mn2+ efflux pump MntP